MSLSLSLRHSWCLSSCCNLQTPPHDAGAEVHRLWLVQGSCMSTVGGLLGPCPAALWLTVCRPDLLLHVGLSFFACVCPRSNALRLAEWDSFLLRTHKTPYRRSGGARGREAARSNTVLHLVLSMFESPTTSANCGCRRDLEHDWWESKKRCCDATIQNTAKSCVSIRRKNSQNRRMCLCFRLRPWRCVTSSGLLTRANRAVAEVADLLRVEPRWTCLGNKGSPCSSCSSSSCVSSHAFFLTFRCMCQIIDERCTARESLPCPSVQLRFHHFLGTPV